MTLLIKESYSRFFRRINFMKNAAVARWVELKKNTRHFETIMQSRRVLSHAKLQGASKWDDMSSFFREADKYIK